MHIKINRFNGFNTNRAGLYLLVGTNSQNAQNISVRQKCRLILFNDEYIFCTIASVRKNTDYYSIKLQMDINIKNIKAIISYIYRDDLSFSLLIQENVDRSIYVEAQSLLRQLSERTGQDSSDLLYQLTTFKNVSGKRELKFVSQKQMVVLIDKIKKLLGGLESVETSGNDM